MNLLDQAHQKAKKSIEQVDEYCSVDMALKRFAEDIAEAILSKEVPVTYAEWFDYMESQ